MDKGVLLVASPKKKGKKRKKVDTPSGEPHSKSKEIKKKKVKAAEIKKKKSKKTKLDENNSVPDPAQGHDVAPSEAEPILKDKDKSSKKKKKHRKKAEKSSKEEKELPEELKPDSAASPTLGTEDTESKDQAELVSLDKPAARTAGRAFRRVADEDWLGKKGAYDNSYEANFGSNGWGAKAHQTLKTVRGKNFRHEKTKKKRGTYFGGKISVHAVNSITFDSD